MSDAPGAMIGTAIFWTLVLAVVLVLAVPSLRSRRWLVRTVVGAVSLLMIAALIWTYMV